MKIMMMAIVIKMLMGIKEHDFVRGDNYGK